MKSTENIKHEAIVWIPIHLENSIETSKLDEIQDSPQLFKQIRLSLLSFSNKVMTLCHLRL